MVARTSGVRATGEKTARAPDWSRTGGEGKWVSMRGLVRWRGGGEGRKWGPGEGYRWCLCHQL